MHSTTIQQIARRLDKKFYPPERLNALFMSSLMKDGETMRNLIHRRSENKFELLGALVRYYESRDKEKLLTEVARLNHKYKGFKAFYVRQQEDLNRNPAHPTRQEVEVMERIIESGQRDIYAFRRNNIESTTAIIYERYYGSFFKKNEQGAYYFDKKVPIALYENKLPLTLFDSSDHESNWLKPELYEQRGTMLVKDEHCSPFPERKFDNARVIDVLRETYLAQKHYNYKCPKTNNKSLNLLCRNLCFDNVFKPQGYVQAVAELNKDIVASLEGKAELSIEHIDAAALLIETAPKYFDAIDYASQFGLYKDKGFHEILKFSYLTSFVKNESFKKEEMDEYIDEVATAGHWMKAQNVITRKILQNTSNLGGINHLILDLNVMKERPEKSYRMLNQYYNRDLERTKYNNLYLDNFRLSGKIKKR